MKADNYRAIPLSSLYPDSKPGFDIFIQVGDSYVKYADHDFIIDAQTLDELHHHAYRALYINEWDEPAYQHYMQELMRRVEEEPGNTERKARAIYTTATAVMEQLFKNPESPEAVRRSKETSHHILENILEDERAFVSLVRVSSYDYYTYTHCINVALYALEIGKQEGFSEQKLKILGEGAILHDLGKSRLDSSVINKEGPLSEAEFQEIKHHPKIGYDLLQMQGEQNPEILDIILHHHEKLDGSGYPEGIKAEQISYFARIVCVADIFDALTTRRSYKPALTSFQAFKMMRSQMKHHLDSEILERFIRSMRGE